jgi:hypothetical protein
LEAEFLKALRSQKIELAFGHRLRRQRLNPLPDLGGQWSELGFHLPQGRPPLALSNAAFNAASDALFDAAFDAVFNAACVGGLHGGLDLVIRVAVQQLLQPRPGSVYNVIVADYHTDIVGSPFRGIAV